jgi:hypothetical protein
MKEGDIYEIEYFDSDEQCSFKGYAKYSGEHKEFNKEILYKFIIPKSYGYREEAWFGGEHIKKSDSKLYWH